MHYEVCGLNCPSCAAKIEKKLKKELDPEASLNINTGTLTLKSGSLKEATKIIQSIEPHVTVTHKDKAAVKAKEHSHAHTEKPNEGLTLLLAAISFGLGFVYKPFFLLGYILSGYSVLLSAFRGIIRRDFLDEKFLMTVATLGALLIQDWAEAAAVMILYSLGELLEHWASDKTRKSVTSLLELTPDTVRVMKDNKTVFKAPDDVGLGDLILVNPGERIPLDGVIIAGISSLDTSALTGESVPRNIKIGDKVNSGVINLTSPLTIEVTSLYQDSTVARMLKLIEEASESKATSEKFITRFARVYTPLVVLGALLLALLPPLLGLGSFSSWGYRALVMLVVSCPCALVISVPLSYFSGIGRASQLGILVKGSEVFDKLHSVKATVWDKTGTLTSGEFSVINIETNNGVTETELLQIAASLEHYSNHPLAKAIQKKANQLPLLEVTDLKELPGLGLKALLNGTEVYVGSLNLMASLGLIAESENDTAAIAVAREGKLLGVIELADQLKPSAAESLRQLKSQGLSTIVLTGDRIQAAKTALHSLPLDDLKAELLPADKLKFVAELEEQGQPTLFVGDGINDAPVIARSSVGIAMGGLGSDAAVEASDVVLVTDEPVKVPLLLQLSEAVRRKVITNITLTLTVKFAVIGLSIIGVATMWQAVIADVGVTILAIINATSLFGKFKN